MFLLAIYDPGIVYITCTVTKTTTTECLPIPLNITSVRSVMMIMAQGGKLLLSAGDGFDVAALMLLPLSSGNDYKTFFKEYWKVR